MKIRYPGMAPTPNQLEKLREIEEAQEGDVHDNAIRQEDFPNGVTEGVAFPLRHEVNQIIWGTHWEYQKRILDHVEAIVASDRQWVVVRKILMAIMTEQVERTRTLVSQRIKQELREIEDDPGSSSRNSS
jgi:hypothetical protein